ncbi:MAG: hypothetical protein L6R39_006357 [Caloplaca ligustica]|nr:MAG: hypothetical protein L6R39_006357 [Caloplaca ligustica]
MHFTVLSLVLLSFLFPLTNAAMVTIHNTKSWPACLIVETSLDKKFRPIGWFPTNTVCNGHPGITVAPFASTPFYPGGNWAGALTPVLNGMLGTRFEINFNVPSTQYAKAGSTWYDADMEFGISAGTIGPSDHRPRYGTNWPSLAGEADPLAKANAAWLRSPKRWELLHYPAYVVADKGSRLVWVYNDKGSPDIVRAFFQLEADFQAYMGPGSVPGVIPTTELSKQLTKSQDEKSWIVDTQDMTITIY